MFYLFCRQFSFTSRPWYSLVNRVKTDLIHANNFLLTQQVVRCPHETVTPLLLPIINCTVVNLPSSATFAIASSEAFDFTKFDTKQ